jgi:hypothetical protein
MNLVIYNQNAEMQDISWNYDEIKKEVADKMQYYKTLVYTDEQVKEAKADKATLNKFEQALESKRKEIKKQCLAPYEKFEKEIKEIVCLVNEPIAMIDSQVKAFEETKKAEKLDAIKQYWNTLEKPEWLEFDRIFINSWLNASTTMSRVKTDMLMIIDTVNGSIQTLEKLPEFSFEAIEVYKQTLDINTAISEAQRMHSIQVAKEQAQASVKAAETVTEPIISETRENIQPEIKRQWIGFKAYLSNDDAKALKIFFDSRNIEFEPLKVD